MQNYKLQKHKTSDIQSFIIKRTEIKVKKQHRKLVYFASLFIALKKQRVLRQFFHTNTLITQGLFFYVSLPHFYRSIFQLLRSYQPTLLPVLNQHLLTHKAQNKTVRYVLTIPNSRS